MALPRVCSFSRYLLSKGSSTRNASSVFLTTRIAIPHRQFASSSWIQQAAIQEQATGSQAEVPRTEIPEALRSKNARSVVVQMIPKRAMKSEVEALFKQADLDIADFEMRLDRFSFINDRYAFAELASEQQVQQAIEKLNGNESLGEPIYVKPLKSDFEWRSSKTFGDLAHCVFWNEVGVSKAVQPILEGRRLHIAVKTPAWGNLKTTVGERNRACREVLKCTLSKFGIESMGPVAVNWGDLKLRPRFLCFVDFQTREGAEDAIRVVHDTEVEGRLVWVKPSELAAWRAYQLGKVDSGLLTKLQEKNMAPKEIDEERFSKGLVRRGKNQV